jgi:5'-3' exonuclease
MELLRDIPGELVVVSENGYTYNTEKLGLVLKAIASDEESHIRHGLIKKLKMNGYVSREAVSNEEKALAIFNALPLTWKVERSMMARSEEGWALKDDWASAYYRDFMWSCAPVDAVKQWFTGIQWVLDYYTGTRAVDMYWYYPWYLPPLFSDIAKQTFVCAGMVRGENAIAPLEQLVMVLPIESYGLLPRAARRLPFMRPEFYPTTWNFFSCGRRQLWECEPMIPMLPYEIVKKMTRQDNPVLC